MSEETIQARIHGARELPTLIYLPGLHGDWTLVSSFRAALKDRVRFIEFTYPCRCDWTLADYAKHMAKAIAERGVNEGWLLAESFSSQVGWKVLELRDAGEISFRPLGLILAGGFVRYPVIWGLHCFHAAHRLMPWWCFRLLLKLYAQYARLRHRRAPETLASIAEFVERRTQADRAAITSRYPLIASNDAREAARRATLPVYALAGFFDPIVPWSLTLPWLRRNCPGYRASRIIFNADHNVLGTAPQKSAEQVLKWMKESAEERGIHAASPLNGQSVRP